MEPRIVELGSFTVLGAMGCFTPEVQDFQGIWDRFMRYHGQIHELSGEDVYYGVSFGTEDEQVMGYLAGMAVEGVAQPPEGLALRVVPASRYAVFECTVAGISDTCDWIFGQWVPAAPYGRPERGSPKVDFELYSPSGSADTPVLIHIALEDRPPADQAS